MMGLAPERANVPFWRIHTLRSTKGPNSNMKASAERLAPVKPFQPEWADLPLLSYKTHKAEHTLTAAARAPCGEQKESFEDLDLLQQ